MITYAINRIKELEVIEEKADKKEDFDKVTACREEIIGINKWRKHIAKELKEIDKDPKLVNELTRCGYLGIIQRLFSIRSKSGCPGGLDKDLIKKGWILY